MSDVLRESLEYLFITILMSAILAPPLISLLYKTNQVVAHKKAKLGGGMGGTNELFLKIMKVENQNGTPNMGGILIWLVVPLASVILLESSDFRTLMLITFLTFGFWGFLDVVVNNKIKADPKLREFQERFWVRLLRFASAVLLNTFVTYWLYQSNLIPSIEIFSWSIDFSPWLIPIIAVVGQFAIYSAEITDGLDGLMIGIFGIIYTALAVLLYAQEQFVFIPFICIVLGVIVIDLYFNIPPARFFNGGPGAMPLGLGAFMIGLVSGNVIPYFFITLVTWGIMSSSLIQILSMKFFKKRVFKIAPIHHHFQAVGWPDYKVTMRFWLATIFVSIIGIYLGLI